MKNTFVLACICALVGFTSMAQDAKPRLSAEDRAQRRTEKLSKKLALNADQSAKIKALMAKEIQKNDEIRQANMERKKAMKAELDKILDDKQRAQLDEMRKEGKDKMRERFKERRMGKQNAPDNDDVSDYMDDVY